MSGVRQSSRAGPLLAALLFGGPALPAAETADLAALLPAADQIPGWRVVVSPREFKGEDLFDLIDGGADLYLEYGFSQVLSCRYETASSFTLQIEIYRMRDDAAAYGVYSITQSGSGTAVEIGEAARLYDYYLTFWKGPYCVNVTASGPSAAARREILRLAGLIAARITATGAVPALVRRLPREALRRDCYVRGPLGLSTLHLFGGDNPFRVQEGAGGFYPGWRLFIFRYPSAEKAAACLAAAGQALAPPVAANATGFAYTDHAGRRIAARLEGDCITVRIEDAHQPAPAPSSPMP